jgi:hypothetical protein
MSSVGNRTVIVEDAAANGLNGEGVSVVVDGGVVGSGVVASRNNATAIAAIVIVPSSSAKACSQFEARGVTRIRGGSSSSG